jgi:hypothetical protein
MLKDTVATPPCEIDRPLLGIPMAKSATGVTGGVVVDVA